MATQQNPYEVSVAPRTKRFLRKNPTLARNFDKVVQYLSRNPYQGRNIAHLKGLLNCSRRLRLGDYRILYSINGEDRIVDIFDSGPRADIYK